MRRNAHDAISAQEGPKISESTVNIGLHIPIKLFMPFPSLYDHWFRIFAIFGVLGVLGGIKPQGFLCLEGAEGFNLFQRSS